MDQLSAKSCPEIGRVNKPSELKMSLSGSKKALRITKSDSFCRTCKLTFKPRFRKKIVDSIK
jgi:hypothetical protein